MLIILFRSKLTPMAGDDYAVTNAELEQHVKVNPGFIEAKGFTTADGERLTVVWWRDRESLKCVAGRSKAREGQASWPKALVRVLPNGSGGGVSREPFRRRRDDAELLNLLPSINFKRPVCG
jgi:heme-degrading monooxygenase HmoA